MPNPIHIIRESERTVREREERRNALKRLKVGDKIKVIANRAGHNYPIGRILTFKSFTNNCGMQELPAILVKEGKYYLGREDYQIVERRYQPIGIWA